MKMMLRLTSMFFLFISFLAGMLVCIEAYQMKDHLMELAIQRVEKFVKTVVIECVPQYDYQEYENTEILYQWTKKAVYGMFFPLWEYQEQYGGSREQLLEITRQTFRKMEMQCHQRRKLSGSPACVFFCTAAGAAFRPDQ